MRRSVSGMQNTVGGDWLVVGRIVYNGLSDFVMLIVEAVMIFIINLAFTKFLTPMHFEAYAAASVLVTLLYSVYFGASMG